MTDQTGSDQQGDTPPSRGWAGFGVAAVGIMAGLSYFVSGLNSGLVEFDASVLWILGAILGVVALIVVAVLVGAFRAQKERLAGLVAKVARKRPGAVIVPGVVESGVISFAPNRPKLPGHAALAVLPDRVELWHWFSDEPSAEVERVPGGISVEPIAATSWNGRRTTVVDHLVCRDDKLELYLVPEYEVRRRADYPAGMRRALREIGVERDG